MFFFLFQPTLQMCGKMLYLNCEKGKRGLGEQLKILLYEIFYAIAALLCVIALIWMLFAQKSYKLFFVYRLLTLMLYFTEANKQLQNGKAFAQVGRRKSFKKSASMSFNCHPDFPTVSIIHYFVNIIRFLFHKVIMFYEIK